MSTLMNLISDLLLKDWPLGLGLRRILYSVKFSRITDKHARKKFHDFYFRDKVTISDHTP